MGYPEGTFSDHRGTMKIGFVGAGRLGIGLATAFSRTGLSVVAVASRRPDSAQALARLLPGARAAGAQEVVGAADLVFLTVPDDAIEGVAAGLAWRPGMACVHCSGAGELGLLGKAAADGAATGGFHPLRMFAQAGEPLASLAGAAVALAGPEPLAAELERLALAIGGRPFRLPEGSRALYHASANFVGGFVIALVQEAVELWRGLGIDDTEALAALLPLARSTLANVEAFGTAGGLGSAVARGDVGTLRRHLEALAERAPDTLPLYRLLALRTIPLALAKGTLQPESARAIEALLGRPGV
jgi:predicted short-subunit dehydrogenase-like oxidoreductase (DUF2520 family)